MIVVPTVPHTGTHFMRDYLLAGLETHVAHPYDHEIPKIYALLEEGNPCIIPRRRRIEVERSWIRHGKDRAKFAGRSLDDWLLVQEGIATMALIDSRLFYLDLDLPGVRDKQLLAINTGIGLHLDARGWPIIRQPNE